MKTLIASLAVAMLMVGLTGVASAADKKSSSPGGKGSFESRKFDRDSRNRDRFDRGRRDRDRFDRDRRDRDRRDRDRRDRERRERERKSR